MGEFKDGSGFTVAMTRSTDTPGIDIVDPIERRRCTLLTDEPVTPREGDPDTFRFPVETAVEVDTNSVSAPFTGHAWVRDGEADLIAKVTKGYEGSFPSGKYSIELSGLIKIYLHVSGPFSIVNSAEALTIELNENSTVGIGSRSAHTRPATTVTTTEDPADILAAISTFGSALKTTSPERSFPTARGHPPAVKLGNESSIPNDLHPPISDLRIEVPPRLEYVYPTVPLAYYLGVVAEPGQLPRLVGEDIDYSLRHPDGFQRGIQEVLQQVFFLDCVTRTEGLYPVEMYERELAEQRVDLPFADLYDMSVTERLKNYLEVPFSVIEDIIPDWRLAAHVDASAASVPMLPYLANDLAIISMADPEVIPSANVSTGMAGFTRGGAETQTRGATSNTQSFVRPTGGAEAIDTAWVSQGTPVNATKAVPEAYENKFGRSPQDHSIEIAVVCNSREMDAEQEVVDEVYGSRDEFSFHVQMHEGLETEELDDLLHQDFNFLHYIGHIDNEGFRCPDGRLDVTDFDEIGPEAFFLNACQSYDQGLALIRGGAIGGIVTLNDVINHGAVRIGQSVARLLNSGFPLRVALDIASNRSVMGRQYVVVGDGNLSIVQCSSGTPKVCHLENTGSSYQMYFDAFGAPPGMGCMYMPHIENHSRQYLSEGTSDRFEFTRQEMEAFLNLENVPVMMNGEISWSFDLTLD